MLAGRRRAEQDDSLMAELKARMEQAPRAAPGVRGPEVPEALDAW